MKNTIFKNARLLELESPIGMSNPCDVFIKNGIRGCELKNLQHL